jgi:hypothetical protein
LNTTFKIRSFGFYGFVRISPVQVIHKYRLLGRTTWGIAIDLFAEYGPMRVGDCNIHQITPGIWLGISPAIFLSETESAFLKRGLWIVGESINSNNPFGEPVRVDVTRVDYEPTDYQPEGLADAIAGWAAKAFGFPKPDFSAKFNKGEGRYTFAFEPWRDEIPEEPESRPADFQRMAVKRLQSARDSLRQGELRPATELAGKSVLAALRALTEPRVSGVALRRAERASDLETVLSLVYGARPENLPGSIGRDITRVGTWFPDFRLAQASSIHQVQLLSRRDVEEFVASAQRIVDWAAAEHSHEPIR